MSENRSGWERYQFPPSFVLGFHGCDRSVGESILQGKTSHLKASENDYDWLGHGIYFWESNPQRALEFAQSNAEGGKSSKGVIKEPFVIGAIINLGYCLDMRDSMALAELQASYDVLRTISPPDQFPSNGKTLKVRNLDCAVFNYLHVIRTSAQLRPYDTIRAGYREGEPLYPDTDLCREDHIQICVRNTDSILGYFRPIN